MSSHHSLLIIKSHNAKIAPIEELFKFQVHQLKRSNPKAKMDFLILITQKTNLMKKLIPFAQPRWGAHILHIMARNLWTFEVVLANHAPLDSKG